MSNILANFGNFAEIQANTESKQKPEYQCKGTFLLDASTVFYHNQLFYNFYFKVSKGHLSKDLEPVLFQRLSSFSITDLHTAFVHIWIMVKYAKRGS